MEVLVTYASGHEATRGSQSASRRRCAPGLRGGGESVDRVHDVTHREVWVIEVRTR